jgi:hypothetical protein
MLYKYFPAYKFPVRIDDNSALLYMSTPIKVRTRNPIRKVKAATPRLMDIISINRLLNGKSFATEM